MAVVRVVTWARAIALIIELEVLSTVNTEGRR